jgi:23S rRNA (uracil1939-C5)-methyltransferase
LNKEQQSSLKCIHYPHCGGCNALTIPYTEQCEKKTTFVKNIFSPLKIEVAPILASTPTIYYRHKVQLPFGTTGKSRNGKTVLGCFANDSHEVIDQHECMIQDRDCSIVAWCVRDWAVKNKVPVYNEKTGNGFLRHVVIRRGASTGEILLGIVTNGERVDGSRRIAGILIDSIQKRISSASNVVGIIQNVNMRSTNVVLGNKEILWWGRPYLKEKLGDLKFKVEMSTFFQVNPFQTPTLYNEVLKRIEKGSTVLDLYCGIASITQWVASKVNRIDGVEENGKSVDAAKVSIGLNKLDNVKVYKDDAASIHKRLSDKDYDTVIIDPPRKGVGTGLCKELIDSGIKKVIYVSCNPLSLAEDLTILSKRFKTSLIQPVDMFPHTEHIECVTELTRN